MVRRVWLWGIDGPRCEVGVEVGGGGLAVSLLGDDKLAAFPHGEDASDGHLQHKKGIVARRWTGHHRPMIAPNGTPRRDIGPGNIASRVRIVQMRLGRRVAWSDRGAVG